MVEAGLTDHHEKDELTQILELIEAGENFLLSGGAGSGKTYTLVQVIRKIIEDHPTSRIACVTYTNSAAKEIEERVNHKNLSVSTYHDFLWDNIKHFGKELKLCLIELINDETVTKITLDKELPIPNNYFDHLEDGVQYKEYLRLREGIISHDEILILANRLFANYSKICQIVKDKHPFILIDEYQDTQKEVIEILLEHLQQSNKKVVIGFFGDSMQAIYDDGIGDLDDYIGEESGDVFEVQKKQNRRNPQRLIELANILRTDDLTQEHSSDSKAPNMIDAETVKEGSIKFIYSTVEDLQPIRDFLGWDFEDSKETKELNLTHNLIAQKGGFSELMEIYAKDRIIELKGKVKKRIKENNVEFEDAENITFGEVLTHTQVNVNIPQRILEFIENHAGLYEYAKGLKWEVFSKIWVSSEQLIDDKKQDAEQESKKGSKRDNLIKHLFKIENSIYLYQAEHYNEFLRKTEFKIKSVEDKLKLKNIIEEFQKVGDKTIEEVIELANDLGICLKDDKLNEYLTEKEYMYNRVKKLPYSQFQYLYKYLEGYTPFSTQHKTKGNEFDNVLVILDNGNWNKYNFENLFLNAGNANVLRRTQKIFYTCCTRAKENLIVFYHNPSIAVINIAREWFGIDSVINFDEIPPQ